MSVKRNVYLDMKPLETVKIILDEAFPRPETVPWEEINACDALGRVLAAPAVAGLSSPNFHAAAMDGIAVDAKVTFGAGEESPKSLVPGKDAFWINTGHVMPPGTNAVIMIEHVQVIDDAHVEIEAPAFPWQNVRKMGEDIVATELLFPRGHRISAYAVGALISGGVFTVKVYKKPRVLIIPTGNELVTWETARDRGLTPGDVIESNSRVLLSLCREHGAEAESRPMVADNLEWIVDAVKTATETHYDMVMIIGGSSAGSMDFARPVISTLGEVFVHGVTMMPGKPVLFGKVNDTPVFGIPGYPVSAIVAFEQLAGPLLLKMQGLPPMERETIDVQPARKMASKLGLEEFLRVKIGAVDDRLIASQLPRGAGSITTITEADGIIRIPANVEGLSEGETVTAELLRPLSSIKNTVVITGSHDNTLDLLADQIRRTRPGVSLSSSHVGSMGGLMAIRKGTCHMAGAHLLTPEDGTYNVSYIKKYLPDTRVHLINLVMREQGLIVPKGNPQGITGLADIAEKELFFINRQPGSGTRILLDYQLDRLDLKKEQIPGYANEEYTHMSVAVAVLSGRAQAGLGIFAAAKALDLDFIPVVTESYDLVIPDRFYDTDKVQVLLETISSGSFKERVRAMGGYGTEKTGTCLWKG